MNFKKLLCSVLSLQLTFISTIQAQTDDSKMKDLLAKSQSHIHQVAASKPNIKFYDQNQNKISRTDLLRSANGQFFVSESDSLIFGFRQRQEGNAIVLTISAHDGAFNDITGRSVTVSSASDIANLEKAKASLVDELKVRGLISLKSLGARNIASGDISIQDNLALVQIGLVIALTIQAVRFMNALDDIKTPPPAGKFLVMLVLGGLLAASIALDH